MTTRNEATKEYLQQVEDCEARESRMSEWEHGFIASLGERLRAGCFLTDTQIEKLDQVWERVTSKG